MFTKYVTASHARALPAPISLSTYLSNNPRTLIGVAILSENSLYPFYLQAVQIHLAIVVKLLEA
jgi:hypothetical protein